MASDAVHDGVQDAECRAFGAAMDALAWHTTKGRAAALAGLKFALMTQRWRAAYGAVAKRFVPPHTITATERLLDDDDKHDMPLLVLAVQYSAWELAAHIIAERDFKPNALSLRWGSVTFCAVCNTPAKAAAKLVRMLTRNCGDAYNPDVGVESMFAVVLDRRCGLINDGVADCLSALLDAGATPQWQYNTVVFWQSNGFFTTNVRSVDELLRLFDAHGADNTQCPIPTVHQATWRAAMRVWAGERGAWMTATSALSSSVGAAVPVCRARARAAACSLLLTVLTDVRLTLPSDDAPHRITSELAALVALFL